MNNLKSLFTNLIFFSVLTLFVIGCEKDPHVPPDISLKTGAGYTSDDATLSTGTDVTVGVTAVKKEDDMLTYNISYAYDGAATTTTYQTFNLTGTEQQNYEKDVTFTTRTQAGTEKWIFTITDKDGNIAQKTILLTVQ